MITATTNERTTQFGTSEHRRLLGQLSLRYRPRCANAERCRTEHVAAPQFGEKAPLHDRNVLPCAGGDPVDAAHPKVRQSAQVRGCVTTT